MPPLSEKIGGSTFTTSTPTARSSTTTCSRRSGARSAVLLRIVHRQGRRGRAAVQAARDRRRRAGRRGVRDLRRVREPRRQARFFRLPPVGERPALPGPEPGMLLLNVRKSGRDHRKILVVDGKIGFVGGYNIGARTRRSGATPICGSRALGLGARERVRRLLEPAPRAARRELPDHGATRGSRGVRVHRNVPAQLIFPIRGMYLEAIDRARSTSRSPRRTSSPTGTSSRRCWRRRTRRRRPGARARGLQPRDHGLALAWLLLGTLLRGGVRSGGSRAR